MRKTQLKLALVTGEGSTVLPAPQDVPKLAVFVLLPCCSSASNAGAS